jgi:hypothetical protein
MATIAAIRDRIAELIGAIVPAALSTDRFMPFANEEGASFLDWCESVPTAAFRRFQVRHEGTQNQTEVADGTVEGIATTFVISVCYPHDHRAGAEQAISRDELIEQDWQAINKAAGLYARGNFFDAHNSTVTSPPVARRVTAEVCDYLVIDQPMFFYRTTL